VTPEQDGLVCLTNPYVWPEVRRGSEAVVRGLAMWMVTQGISVEVVGGGATRGLRSLDGVPVVVVRARDLRRLHHDLDAETTLLPPLALHLRRRHPRLVHSFLYPDACAARLAGLPYVVSYGGIALSFAGHRVKRALFKLASDGARAIVCPSAAAAEHLAKAYGYKAEVIPNGLNVDRFGVDAPPAGDVVLCAATPDDRRKRLEVLVDAFSILSRRRPAVELVLAGTASPQAQAALLERLPEEHVRGRVRFIGDVDAEELTRLYASAAVTCLPSLNEAFGMVLVESLAAGTPVVGAHHGGIPEIVDDEVAATFTPDDPEACARALEDVLERASDPGLSDRCRERARRYDWSVVGPRFLELYERVA